MSLCVVAGLIGILSKEDNCCHTKLNSYTVARAWEEAGIFDRQP